jgi:hypothetical protein
VRYARASSFAASFLLATVAVANTYTVTTTADSGAGSLRQAILDSNASVGVTDTIAFNITGAGCAGSPAVCTIKPTSGLPALTDPVVIDGYTQSGSSPNTLTIGDNAVLLVEIDGSLAGSAHGIVVQTDTIVIQGLVINRFNPSGLYIDAAGGLGTAGGHVIRGNFIGTDPTGTIAAPSAQYAIYLRSPNDTVGGPNPADRNVLVGSGNTLFDAAIRFEADFGGSVSGDLLQGNYIGTNAAGTAPLGAGDGIYIGPGSGITIGGAGAGEGNLISGNGRYGIQMTGPGCGGAISGNVIQGNLIGVDATGTAALGNGWGGLLVSCTSSGNQIGGTAPGAGNVIANNGATGDSAGILLDTAGAGNAIRGNQIYANNPVGIGLGLDAVIPNDLGDGDTGPNDKQNFPVISSVAYGASSTTVTGLLNSTANTTFDLDFYSNPACSNFPREFLQGQTYLGSKEVTTDGSGNAPFDVTGLPATENGARISATATDPSGSTSEFSQRLPFSVTPTSGAPSSFTAITITGTNFLPGAGVTVGGAAATGVSVTNYTTITATTPALAPGSANNLVVTNTDGTNGTLVKAFIANFVDVPQVNQFYSYVTTLVSNAITVGVGGGLYGVGENTLRQQMAVFLLKGKHGLCYVPPACTPGFFTDVACPSTFADWIQEMAVEGITGGCGTGLFCPGNPVLRGQMAVFLLKAQHGSSYLPPACTPPGVFPDVPCPGTFTDWIEQLAAENITGGCGGGDYCPSGASTRGQMAVFIVKTFGLM